MIRLPLESQVWARLRVVTAASFNASNAAPDTDQAYWDIEPMAGGSASGYEVMEVERVCLPQIGRAVLRYRVGVIDGKLVGEQSAGATPAAWDPASMTSLPPSLVGREIRIQQVLDPTAEGSDQQWVTVFWGQVEYEEDEGWPGSVLPAGERRYHLTDALARTRKWLIDRHAYSGGTGTATMRNGPVGYNMQDGDVVRGNRGTTNVIFRGVQVREHVNPGAGSTWTDEDIIEHALAVSRPTGEPSWVVPSSESTDYLNSAAASSIKVDRETSALDVLTKTADWKRGRGVVFLAWEETPSGDTSVEPLRTYLACAPPVIADFSRDVTALGGSTLSWQGATSYGSKIDVDLIGDHRVIDSAFKLGDANQFRGYHDFGCSQSEYLAGVKSKGAA